MIRCPRCLEWTASDSGDLIHECHSGKTVLDNEDVVNTGDFYNHMTQQLTKSNNETNLQGLQNKVYGMEADRLGIKVYDWTERGKRAATHRTRQHLEYIQVSE